VAGGAEAAIALRGGQASLALTRAVQVTAGVDAALNVGYGFYSKNPLQVGLGMLGLAGLGRGSRLADHAAQAPLQTVRKTARRLPVLQRVCFAPGTRISCAEGDKAIEELHVGDKVWAWAEGTGESHLSSVSSMSRSISHEMTEIHLDGEVIRTTGSHLFWVEERGWTQAAALRRGDRLKRRKGTSAKVNVIQSNPVSLTVYNLEVEDLHTYFVSAQEVLVHNACEIIADTQLLVWATDPNRRIFHGLALYEIEQASVVWVLPEIRDEFLNVTTNEQRWERITFLDARTSTTEGVALFESARVSPTAIAVREALRAGFATISPADRELAAHAAATGLTSVCEAKLFTVMSTELRRFDAPLRSIVVDLRRGFGDRLTHLPLQS